MQDLEALEAHIRLAHFFVRLDELDSALWLTAQIRRDVVLSEPYFQSSMAVDTSKKGHIPIPIFSVAGRRDYLERRGRQSQIRPPVRAIGIAR